MTNYLLNKGEEAMMAIIMFSEESSPTCLSVPDVDQWRLPLLVKLLEQKMEMEAYEENSKSIRELIDSLCCS